MIIIGKFVHFIKNQDFFLQKTTMLKQVFSVEILKG